MMIHRLSLALITALFFSCCQVEGDAIQEEEILTVEVMLSKRASEYIDIGEKSDEIIANLTQVTTYGDILQFIRGRGEFNNVKCRKLDFETFQFIEDIRTKDKKRINLVYLVRNDSVKYGVIESIDSNYIELVTRTEFKRDDDFINKYVNNHNRLYLTRKTNEDFILETIKTRDAIRVACGNAATGYGEKEKTLFKEIRKKNSSYVMDLLTSMNPEEQAMGIVGVRKLTEAGIEFDEETIRIVNHILRKNTSVYACMTCMYGLFELDEYLIEYRWSAIPNIPLE